jgi:hypothetical protein
MSSRAGAYDSLTYAAFYIAPMGCLMGVPAASRNGDRTIPIAAKTIGLWFFGRSHKNIPGFQFQIPIEKHRQRL